MPIIYGKDVAEVDPVDPTKNLTAVDQQQQKPSESDETTTSPAKHQQNTKDSGINSTETTQDLAAVDTPSLSAAEKGNTAAANSRQQSMKVNGPAVLTFEEPTGDEIKEQQKLPVMTAVAQQRNGSGAASYTGSKSTGKSTDRKRRVWITVGILFALLCILLIIVASVMGTRKAEEEKRTEVRLIRIEQLPDNQTPSYAYPYDLYKPNRPSIVSLIMDHISRLDKEAPQIDDDKAPAPDPPVSETNKKCSAPPTLVDGEIAAEGETGGVGKDFVREIDEDESQQYFPAFRPIVYDLHFQIAPDNNRRFRVNTKITGLVSSRKSGHITSFMLHLDTTNVFTEWNRRSPSADVPIFRIWHRQSLTPMCIKRVVRVDRNVLRFEMHETNHLESGTFYVFQASGLDGKIMGSEDGPQPLKTVVMGYKGGEAMFPCVDHPKVKALFQLTTETLESSDLTTISAFGPVGGQRLTKQIEQLNSTENSLFGRQSHPTTKIVTFDRTFWLPPHAFSFVICQNCKKYSLHGTTAIISSGDEGEKVKDTALEGTKADTVKLSKSDVSGRIISRRLSFRFHFDDSFSSQAKIKTHMYHMFEKAERCLEFMEKVTKVMYPLKKMEFVQVAKSALKNEATMGLIDSPPPTIQSADGTPGIDISEDDPLKGPDLFTRKIMEQWIGNLITEPIWHQGCIYTGLVNYLHLLLNQARSSLAAHRSDKLLKGTFWNFDECELQVTLILDMLMATFGPDKGLFDWLQTLMTKYKYANPGFKEWAAEISAATENPLAGKIWESYYQSRGFPFLFIVPNGSGAGGMVKVRQVTHETAITATPIPNAPHLSIPILVTHSGGGDQSWIMNSHELTVNIEEEEDFGTTGRSSWYVLDKERMVVTRNLYDPENYIALFGCFHGRWEAVKRTQEIPAECPPLSIKTFASVYFDFCFAYLHPEFPLPSTKENRNLFDDAFDKIRDFAVAYSLLDAHKNDAFHPLSGNNWKCACCLARPGDFENDKPEWNNRFYPFEGCTVEFRKESCKISVKVMEFE